LTALRALIIEDDEDDFLLARDMLGEAVSVRYRLDWEPQWQVGLEATQRQGYDIVLVDYRLGASNGLELVRQARAMGVTLPFILLTGEDSREIDQEVLLAGASDYLVKSQITAPLLDRAIRYAIERKRNEEQLLQLAQFDSLTGLANRAHFNSHLKGAIARAKRSGVQGALFLLDLDNLKKVNDSLGHPEGDRLLQEFASRLSACIRESDFVARLGGDEFAIIGSNIEGAESAASIARNIGKIFETPFSLSGQNFHSGASVGISLFPADSDQPGGLLKNADMALYEAKNKSRGSYRFFDDAMNLRAQARRTMAVELRDAVLGGQLELYYQPKVSASNGAMVGVEALSRWTHPQRGTISPEAFIPAAETSGTIVALGAWVLRTTCEQLNQWRAAGLPPIPVSINLSPVELRQAGFVESVRRVLAEIGIDPLLIEFEITENVVMENSDSRIKMMRALQAIGISLAIDDFGVGYSSLSYLMNFPVDRLKIDRCFISRVTDDPNAAAIARTVIALARTSISASPPKASKPERSSNSAAARVATKCRVLFQPGAWRRPADRVVPAPLARQSGQAAGHGAALAGFNRQRLVPGPLAHRLVIDGDIGVTELVQHESVEGGGDAAAAISNYFLVRRCPRIGENCRDGLRIAKRVVGRIEQRGRRHIDAAGDAAGPAVAVAVAAMQFGRQSVEGANRAVADGLLDRIGANEKAGLGSGGEGRRGRGGRMGG